MHAYTNDRVHSPAAKLAERENLAALMAAFEAAQGPIETLPIVRRTEQRRPMYNRGTNATPGKETQPKAAKPAAKPQLPFAARGTPQAKQAAILREEWLQ